MPDNLIPVLREPTIPQSWDYEESIKKVQRVLYKWKTMTKEIAEELWIAREKLNEGRKRTASGTFVPMDKSWAEYCADIGSSKRVVNRWLAAWFSPSMAHVSHNSGENEWYTPPALIEAAKKVWEIVKSSQEDVRKRVADWFSRARSI